MARDPQDSWNDLVTRGIDLSAGLLHLYGETWRSAMSRKLSYAEFARRASELARHEGGAYARAMTRAGFDFWERVLAAGEEMQAHADDTPRSSGFDQGQAAATEPAPDAGARLEFHGRSGEALTRAFVVKNSQAEPVAVSFEISSFRSEHGDAGVDLPLTIDPEAFDLVPGQEQIISCRLSLTDQLDPGERYRALLRVIGFPGLEIEIIAIAVDHESG